MVLVIGALQSVARRNHKPLRNGPFAQISPHSRFKVVSASSKGFCLPPLLSWDFHMDLHHLPNATVITEVERLESYLRDESHVQGVLPLAVVQPNSPEDLRLLAALAQKHGWALVPRGAGTGKAGGAVAIVEKSAVIVDMQSWPGEITVSRERMSVTAPVSAYLRDIKSAAEEAGLFYPPDPNSWDQCSLGGSLATNAGGPCAAKYGMTRHWVLSVEALMADGELHQLGISTVKNNAGPNLAQLMVGSEGIFGIMTSATLRLMPKPSQLLTLLLPAKHWHALLDLPARLLGKGLLPSAFEFWDPAVLNLLRQHGPENARRLPGEALALLEFDDANCTTEPFMERVLEALGESGENVEMATDTRQREQLWSIRRQTSVVLKEHFPGKVSEDIVIPRDQIRAFFDSVQALKLPLVAYGHLGDGNLHVNFLHAAEIEPQQFEQHLNELFNLCIHLGGTLSGEHGLGIAKRSAFLKWADPYLVQSLRAIKKALDPDNIFNPGKVI